MLFRSVPNSIGYIKVWRVVDCSNIDMLYYPNKLNIYHFIIKFGRIGNYKNNNMVFNDV